MRRRGLRELNSLSQLVFHLQGKARAKKDQMFTLSLLNRPFFANGVNVSLVKEICYEENHNLWEEERGWRSVMVSDPNGIGVFEEIDK